MPAATSLAFMTEKRAREQAGQGGAPGVERRRATLTPGRAAHISCKEGKEIQKELAALIFEADARMAWDSRRTPARSGL